MTELIQPFKGIRPQVGGHVFVADTARIIGDVEIGDYASIWFGSVLRGDVGSIRIGARSNIQDLSLLHLSYGISNTVIGEDVTVGHRAVIHGAVVGDGALIGIGAILLDNCEVGAECLVGAGSVVTPGTKIPARRLVLGQPARVVRELDASEWSQGRTLAARYVELAQTYRDSSS